mmetsp:Transcript_9725/g.21368  ORF Transcript_9725/g.21368 Transcript_9725/m.21368 type:complete len:104 (+) Transcript_9725:116-427(+)
MLLLFVGHACLFVLGVPDFSLGPSTPPPPLFPPQQCVYHLFQAAPCSMLVQATALNPSDPGSGVPDLFFSIRSFYGLQGLVGPPFFLLELQTLDLEKPKPLPR